MRVLFSAVLALCLANTAAICDDHSGDAASVADAEPRSKTTRY